MRTAKHSISMQSSQGTQSFHGHASFFRILRVMCGSILFLSGTSAHAGIAFTPHLSEYSRLPPGQYTEATFVFTEIEHIYDRDGNKVKLGLPFVPPGASTDAALGLFKMLWVGNIFRDSGIPVLSTHPQFCRMIGVLGYQQNTEQIAERVRLFGKKPGANGHGDLFGLCGIYTDDYLWGPVKANALLATTVKFPVGRYDQDAALNIGTNYWSTIPQFAFHSEIFGRIYIDGTIAYQFNGNNDKPSFGGLTPTRIADWKNAEINVAWKFNEHWFADVGYSYRASVGSNHYDKVTINFVDQPLAPESACANTNAGLQNLGIDPLATPEICNSPLLTHFFLEPRPGPYSDRGVMGRALTGGFYYVYRTSSVFNFRVFYPIAGRGSQIDVLFDVCTSEPCGPDSADNISTLSTTLYGVQEAAAISATPFYEFRLVYLFWAP
jgi:hypothetical protein